MIDDGVGLEDSRLYLVSTARLAAGDVVDIVPELADAGVDLLQLREKDMEAGDLLRIGSELRDACRVAGIGFVLNDRPDVAAALDIGVHVGQNDLPVELARRFVGDGRVVGLSTHSRAEIDAVAKAARPPDYVAVGPLYSTPTKPGRPSVGLDLARYAASALSLPWFAIGGIDERVLPSVLDAGARRIVVVRAITEAPDPPAAAAALRKLLDEVPL